MPHYRYPVDLPAHGTNFPPAPYFYDDYRIIYDEPCFFYDGGYDLVCLVQRGPRLYGGKTPYPNKVYPQPEFINLIFKTCIEYVNDKDYTEEECCEIKKYEFPKEEKDILIKATRMNVKRRLFKIVSDEFNVNTVSRFMDKDNNPTSIVSSSMCKLSTRVSSSLHFSKPKKFKLNSSIIKDDKK